MMFGTGKGVGIFHLRRRTKDSCFPLLDLAIDTLFGGRTVNRFMITLTLSHVPSYVCSGIYNTILRLGYGHFIYTLGG